MNTLKIKAIYASIALAAAMLVTAISPAHAYQTSPAKRSRHLTKPLDGDAGHGGGLICIAPGNCRTLAEAGLKIKETNEGFYRISIEVLKEVKSILEVTIKNHIVRENIFKRVLGNTQTYQPVEMVDPAKLQKLKREYAITIKRMDSSFSLENFEIAAWSDSSSDKTYLLPLFFNLDREYTRNIRKQAQVLIHEANVRTDGITLSQAVKFDVYLSELLANPRLSDDINFDYPSFAKLIEEMKLDANGLGLNREAFLAALTDKLQFARGIPLQFSEFCTENELAYMVHGSWYSYGCTANYEKLMKLADIDPRLTLLLENQTVYIGEDHYVFNYDEFGSKKITYKVLTGSSQEQDISPTTFYRFQRICSLSKGLKTSPDNYEKYLVVSAGELSLLKSEAAILECGPSPSGVSIIPKFLYSLIRRHQ